MIVGIRFASPTPEAVGYPIQILYVCRRIRMTSFWSLLVRTRKASVRARGHLIHDASYTQKRGHFEGFLRRTGEKAKKPRLFKV
jgi:hypothetical protein